MIGFLKRMRKQKAVWWQRGEPNTYGEFAFADPVEVKCRWEDVSQEFLDPRGQTRTSRSVVYVDRVMSVGDKLLRGELDSNSSITDAFEIQKFDQLPDLKNKAVLLTAYL